MLPPFNPFLKFTQDKLQLIKQFNQIYVVKQTFYRNPEGAKIKKQFLLSEYADVGLALSHMRALKNDEGAELLDLNNEQQYNKLVAAIAMVDKYDLWWAKVKLRREVDQRIKALLQKNMARWIMKHTTWRIKREYGMSPSHELVFGELIVILRYGGRIERPTLKEIEES